MRKKFEEKRDKWKEQIFDCIEIVTNNDYRNLDNYIKDKKIVLLGENTHWASELYTTKIDIINHLHHQHGFNTVILESSLMESIFWNDSNEKNN